jgi:hypothetical protein
MENIKMKTRNLQTEVLTHDHAHILCWRSLVAGLFISGVTYLLLTALGTGIGGLVASGMVDNETASASGLATGAGLWLGISAIISLFVGAYFAVRAAKFTTTKIGVSNGLALASLFFILLVWGLGNTVGSVVSGLTKTAMTATTSAAALSANPDVQDTLQRAIGTSSLKSDPKVVAEGLAVRLMRGNTQSATAYLAYQTGQTEPQVSARVTQLQSEFDAKAKIVAEKTANAVAGAGWSLFVTLLVGILGAAIGGWAAAKENSLHPLARFQDDTIPVRNREYAKV